MKGREFCRAKSLVPYRTLPGEPSSWRTVGDASSRELPSFFLHDSGGANFTSVRSELRRLFRRDGGGPSLAEEHAPIAFSQYLVDVPLVEALETHPRRTHDRAAAQWHILAATPFASRFLALLGQNITADGQRVCLPDGSCDARSPRMPQDHRKRLSELVRYLESDPYWRRPGVPFVLFSTGISITVDLSEHVIAVLRKRNEKVGPVILAGVDRSGVHMSAGNLPLLRRMVVLPHVASPEAALHANLCMLGRRAHAKGGGAGGHSGGPAGTRTASVAQALRASMRTRGVTTRSTARSVGSTPQTPPYVHASDARAARSVGSTPTSSAASAISAALESGCRVPLDGTAADSVGQTEQPATPASAPAQVRTAEAPLVASRVGLLFHGDNGRFDFGARGAVRDMAEHLRAPHDFQGLRLMLVGGAANASRAVAHAHHRTISQHTTRAMLDASVCFAPQGDTDTSRRLFDALSTGCVPVIVKVVGGKPREAMLANLPFHHSIHWRGIVHMLAAGAARLEDRHKPTTRQGAISCRREEAAQLDAWHDDVATLRRMRRNGLAAFHSFLDVEMHPRGVANALLRELAYVLTDLPTSLYLPPPHVLPAGMRPLGTPGAWRNLSDVQWMWK